MKDMHEIRLTVNGREHQLVVEARRTLADMLRHDLGYTGTHLGCEHGICGACTVILDGAPVRACLVFGVQADGTEVRTVEGLADGEQLSDLQQAFSDHHALQCGFCTPGFLMLAEAYLAEAYLAEDTTPLTEEQARELVASNLCRCTGYQGIIEAVLATARARQAGPETRGRGMTVIGARLPRQEDPRLLRGRGRFGDDISAPGQLWARVVRSRSAHGQVRGLDVTEAAQAPGMTAVVTAEDLPSRLVIPVRLAIAGTDLSDFLQPVLAADTVRYVGEPVAVVVGDDPYACEDAAELIEIEITERPAVLDARSPQHHQENVAAELTRGYGDTAAAFAAAAHVVRIELAIGRHSGVPLEPRCLLAVPADRGELDIFGMTKVPVWNRDLLADMLGLDETLIHVHAIDAGGGFGVRGEFYPEDFLIPWLAMKLGPPRQVGRGPGRAPDGGEPLPPAVPSHRRRLRRPGPDPGPGRRHHPGQRRLLPHPRRRRVSELTAAMLPGPYRVPAYPGRVRVVLTNKTPCGTYRAPGRFEGTTAREHLLDVAATQLGIDPIRLRMKNPSRRARCRTSARSAPWVPT